MAYRNIILCLAGPYGAGSSSLACDLIDLINEWPKCHAVPIKVSEYIEQYYPAITKKQLDINHDDRAERRKYLQGLGTELRTISKDLIGHLISLEIYSAGRRIEDENINADYLVFVIDCIKNTHDIQELHRIYGTELFFIFVHSSKDLRWQRATQYKNWQDTERHSFEECDQIDKDEKLERPEVRDRGQQVQKLSSMADYYIVNNQNRQKLISEGRRFLELILGLNSHSPTIHEKSMHLAFSAAMRSFCLSRQVGAAIVDGHGNLLALGHNDAPASNGGLYSAEHSSSNSDHRCYVVGDRRCISDTNKQERLDSLSEALLPFIKVKGKKRALSILENLAFRDATEYSRAVHAEMEALLSICRTGGPSVIGGSAYITTEPCHNCIKHLICAGIKKIFFIEPYPKSLGLELHADSLNSDHDFLEDKTNYSNFEGVSPHRYQELFAYRDRKTDDGYFVNGAFSNNNFTSRLNTTIECRGRKEDDENQLTNVTTNELKAAAAIGKLLNDPLEE